MVYGANWGGRRLQIFFVVHDEWGPLFLLVVNIFGAGRNGLKERDWGKRRNTRGREIRNSVQQWLVKIGRHKPRAGGKGNSYDSGTLLIGPTAEKGKDLGRHPGIRGGDSQFPLFLVERGTFENHEDDGIASAMGTIIVTKRTDRSMLGGAQDGGGTEADGVRCYVR